VEIVGGPVEIVLLLVVIVLPVAVIGAVIYAAVRLAIRHERRDQSER
jgi:hypothetical protein